MINPILKLAFKKSYFKIIDNMNKNIIDINQPN